MTKLNIFTYRDVGEYGTQIWEYYYSYKQYKAFPNTPNIDINFYDITQCNPGKFTSSINIFHATIFDLGILRDTYFNEFDLVIIDNTFEHLMSMSTTMLNYCNTYDNCYIAVGGYIHPSNALYDKCITFPEDWANCRNWYVNPKTFVSYFMQSDVNTHNKSHKMIYIGGELRSWRKYISDQLDDCIDIIQNSKTITRTLDAIASDTSTQQFIAYCNSLYGVSNNEIPKNMFHERISFGLQERIAGEATVSYCVLDEYKTYKCVVYPETSLVNNEFFITEKTIKCMMLRVHFIFFAGCNAYELAKRVGVRSILELVPGGLDFDTEINPIERYKKQIQSIKFLNNHPEIFESAEAKDILNENFTEFVSGNDFMIPSVNKMDNILEKYQ